nr:hypothetical protein CFP56_02874 [Quercus suber]
MTASVLQTLWHDPKRGWRIVPAQQHWPQVHIVHGFPDGYVRCLRRLNTWSPEKGDAGLTLNEVFAGICEKSISGRLRRFRPRFWSCWSRGRKSCCKTCTKGRGIVYILVKDEIELGEMYCE